MRFRRAVVDETPETRADEIVSISDPGLAEFLGLGHVNDAGISLTESTSLGLSAVWRSVSLIAGTIASLPLPSYKDSSDKVRTKVATFMDNPHPDMSPFEWKEQILVDGLLWGNVYLLHVYGGAGQLLGLRPLPPYVVHLDIDRKSGEKVFNVTLRNGTQRKYSSLDVTHIPALGTDGVRGLSPISVARHSMGAAMAGDKAAAKMFKNGLLVGGVLTPKSGELNKTQKGQVLDGLRGMAGVDHAGDVAFVPAALDFKPWTMSALDAQFLESRHFGIEEVARWYGVPRELLSESGASSWGSGIQELVSAFARFTLMTWTTRVEQRLSMLLPRGTFCEFDYSGLLQPSPEVEIDLLIRQVEAKLLTVDEARAIRNLPPLPSQVSPESLETEETGAA